MNFDTSMYLENNRHSQDTELWNIPEEIPCASLLSNTRFAPNSKQPHLSSS